MNNSLKKLSILLLSLILILCTTISLASPLYSDLKTSHWCYEKIIDFVDKKYIEGYEDGTMRPDRTITRAEYVKVVNNFFGYEDTKTSKKFSDVSEDAWYAKYVYTAVANGYIEGFEDNTFRPNNPITRQEATVILSRILKIDKEVYPKNHKDGLAQYSDGHEVASWAYTPIHSYSVYNFINGYEDGSLRILQNVTRAETVELLNILEQKIKDDEGKIETGGGGYTKPTVKVPTINIWKLSGDVEYIKASKTLSGWFNLYNSTRSGEENIVIANITTATTGATIYERLDTRSGERNYITTNEEAFDNALLLSDGIYSVEAYATKNGYKDSTKTNSTIKVDTIAPVVKGTKIENINNLDSKSKYSVEVTINDPKKNDVNEISGLDESKLKYAWFRESGEVFVRMDDWNVINLSGEKVIINAPTIYGKYKLGVSAYDIAENSFGKLEDIIVTASGEEKIPFDFVEEEEDIIINIGDISGTLTSTNTDLLSAEPGFTIEYDLRITNKEKNDENVKISFNKPVTVAIGKDSYILSSGEILNQKINIPGNDNVTIKVFAEVPENYPVATEEFNLTCNIGILSGDEIVETKKCNELDEVEKTVTVATRAAKDKNVVVVIDMSGSMLFCTEHTHYESYDNQMPYRYDASYEIPSAFASIPSKIEGEYMYSGYPLIGHQYKVGDNWVTCNVKETRIEVTEKALYDFVKVLEKAAKVNDENISFTIVTFSGSGDIGKTFIFNKNSDNLEEVNFEIDNETNLTVDGGTNIGEGVNAGVAAFEGENMLQNADNYFVFFGDGKPTSGKMDASEFTDVKNGVINYAYAIGFGAAFEDEESNPYKVLQAIVGMDNVTHAENADAILGAFNKIAKTIASSKQSENGIISVNLPKTNYYPINFTYVSGDETINLYPAIENSDNLATLEDVKIENNKLIWDISGSEYSAYKGLKVQLTIDE